MHLRPQRISQYLVVNIRSENLSTAMNKSSKQSERNYAEAPRSSFKMASISSSNSKLLCYGYNYTANGTW